MPAGQEGWGDVKLIDGLYYYDSGYDQHADHMRRIDAMMEEGRRHKATGAATQPGPPPNEQGAH